MDIIITKEEAVAGRPRIYVARRHRDIGYFAEQNELKSIKKKGWQTQILDFKKNCNLLDLER
jgi:hypothetical protein